jgi:hypothetical protein
VIKNVQHTKPKWQTHREVGTQSKGSLEDSPATEGTLPLEHLNQLRNITMLRLTLISLSLFACNSFESQEQGTEPSTSSFIIVESKAPLTAQGVKVQVPSVVVLEIPELNLEVREVQSTTNEPEETIDILHKMQAYEEISEESAFIQNLRAERMMSVSAISALPSDMVKEIQVEHRLTTIYSGDTELYTSELLRSIILASNNNAELVYIPLNAEEVPSILFEGISYGQTKGILFFDAQGDLL